MSSNGRKRALGSASGRPPKIRKPRKPASEDEDSNDSTSAEQQQDPQRELSPIIDDPNMKLPEVSLLDVHILFNSFREADAHSSFYNIIYVNYICSIY